MRTEFALLAIYNCTLIPLEQFCTKEMGITLQTAKNRLSAGTFDVPVIRQNKKLLVHYEDAARWIDAARQQAVA